jgi:UDP-N-acetylmuramoyl-tripeptide--D-alanyl-D-alanine ligase
MQIEMLYKIFKAHPCVQTDTRALEEGQIFFALKGPNFNGNTFASKALELGAVAVVVDEETSIVDERIFQVEDALSALQALALHHRKQFNIPFIAITGSNGKTTTKELIYVVLSSTYKTYTTKGNLNNHIGVPLTILSIKEDAEMALIEMGANHQKEIESYCKIALPTHGIINNCGKAHLEGFGGIEGIRKGKGELFDFLASNQGKAIINSDLDYLLTMSKKIEHVLYYGNTLGEIKTSIIKSEPFLLVEIENNTMDNLKIQTQLVGSYNKPNVEAAIAVGIEFGISIEKIKRAIENYQPDNARSQMITKGSNKIILDAYNANPSSMQVALENFAEQQVKNKYLFLGAMMELGEYSIKEHEYIISSLVEKKLQNTVLVGGDFGKIIHPFTYFESADMVRDWLKDNPIENALILIKGSRSTKMEKILELL